MLGDRTCPRFQVTRKSKREKGRQILAVAGKFTRSEGSYPDLGVISFKHCISLPVLPVVQEVGKGQPSGGRRSKAVMRGWLRLGGQEQCRGWGPVDAVVWDPWPSNDIASFPREENNPKQTK